MFDYCINKIVQDAKMLPKCYWCLHRLICNIKWRGKYFYYIIQLTAGPVLTSHSSEGSVHEMHLAWSATEHNLTACF